MDRRTFLATSLVSGASLAALGHFSKIQTATARQPNLIGAQPSQEPVVLITGTSSGIGKASAIAFARDGYNVVATMRRVKGRNANAARELTTLANAAEIVATEIVKSASTQKGQRPNRVCLSGQLVVDINTVMQNAQKEVISGTPYAPWQTLNVQ